MGRLGPYVVRKVLGVGAMGVVFEAEDPRLGRLVALKVMRPSLAAIEEYRRRFTREARLAAAIEHDNLVPIYEVVTEGDVPYLAMKLLQGETLEDRIARSPGKVSAADALRIAGEIAEGLEVAHARGLIHRDIKPANIWLEAGKDRVKILDFGLARGTGDDGRFTQAGAVIGTPAYMSPEQSRGEETDSRCDLFCLGIVLYRSATGTLPFAGKDTLSILSALASTTPPAPHTVEPSLPQPFSDLVMRLLAKDRADRPQTAREVVDAVEGMKQAGAVTPSPGTADSAIGRVLNNVVVQPVAKILSSMVDSARTLRGSGVRQDGAKSGVGGERSRSAWFKVLAVAGVVMLVLTAGLILGLGRSDSAGASSVGQQKATDSPVPPLQLVRPRMTQD
jgi:serine/threonine protein kinase